MDTTLTNEINVKPGGVGTGSDDFGGGGGDGPKDSGEWPPGFSRDDAIEPAKYRIGMMVGLASILMLFVALTSAYIVRQTQGLSSDIRGWVTIDMPPVLWATTAMIVASSLTIELARRSLRRNDYSHFNGWIAATTFLGICFVGGQLLAWQQLRAQGIYVNSNPHSSFFYLLTSLHGVHLLGGLIALAYVTYAALRLRISQRRRNAVEVTAMYWHFMDGLWLYLFLLLFFWR
ncbi:MAG TPA: cytochrome c oxidase subunit 3 [Blastocatellia bacterium]|nr:cytochrome c oxidase subunit 3 [Blastocatellia bacterium]